MPQTLNIIRICCVDNYVFIYYGINLYFIKSRTKLFENTFKIKKASRARC